MRNEVFAKMSKSQKVTLDKHQEEKNTFVGNEVHQDPKNIKVDWWCIFQNFVASGLNDEKILRMMLIEVSQKIHPYTENSKRQFV